MTVSLITPKETINHENIIDMIIPTVHGQRHIDNKNGNVDLLKKWKIVLLLKKEWSNKPETVEFYVNNGVVYVEQKIVNIVTEDIN